MILQRNLNLDIAEDCIAGLKKCDEPLRKFRQLAILTGVISCTDDLGVLRRLCFDLGLSKAGWRFLNRYDEDAYAALIPIATDDLYLMGRAISYVSWQCAGGLQKPLPVELGRPFITCIGGSFDPASEIDPRIANVASAHWRKLDDPVKREVFVQDEWVRVLNWLRDEKPSFDRNQWRSGWTAIYRRYRKWQKLNPGRLAWQSVLPEFEQDGLHIKPLTTSFALAKEGERMGSCVATYARHCISGNYRLFSISENSSGRVLATAGLVKDDGYWRIDQVKGKFNRDPEARTARLGRVIQNKYMRREKMIAIKKTEEHRQCIDQLRKQHEAYLSRRHSLPAELRAEFSQAEIVFLEKHAAWLGALASGELPPNAFEQVRFIAVSKGILIAKSETEKIWKRLQRLGTAQITS